MCVNQVEDLLASVQGAGVALTDDDAKELTSLLASQAEARGIEVTLAPGLHALLARYSRRAR